MMSRGQAAEVKHGCRLDTGLPRQLSCGCDGAWHDMGVLNDSSNRARLLKICDFSTYKVL